MKLYIDVEGTLVVHSRSGNDPIPRPADGLEQFLDRALGVADCYWLTGVDRSGSHDGILRAFRTTLGPVRYRELQPVLLAIRPTYWGRSKLDAIDLSDDEEWFWIDDAHGQAEKIILKGLGLQDRAVNCPYNGLREVREEIEERMLSPA